MRATDRRVERATTGPRRIAASTGLALVLAVVVLIIRMWDPPRLAELLPVGGGRY
jgi:hypothetical protein